MTLREQWARAFARQAESDFESWERLQSVPGTPVCHGLQFLQMACEKLTKAHLIAEGSNPADLQSSHAYIAKNLPLIIRGLAIGARVKRSKARWFHEHCKHLSREIELLAPSVKRAGQRPDNCEYPWRDEEGRIYAPRDWTFMVESRLLQPAGVSFLKCIRAAIAEYS